MQIPGIARIDANDMDRNASESIRRNVAFNGEEASSRVHAVCHDVRHLMMQSNKVRLLALMLACTHLHHRDPVKSPRCCCHLPCSAIMWWTWTRMVPPHPS
jgi:hypothetical protein